MSKHRRSLNGWRRKGIALSKISGTGPGNQITKDDVIAYVNGQGAAPVEAAPAEAKPALPGDLADVPSLDVRRVAAEHNVNLAEIAQGRPLSSLTRYDVLRRLALRSARNLLPPRLRRQRNQRRPRFRPNPWPRQRNQHRLPCQPQPANCAQGKSWSNTRACVKLWPARLCKVSSPRPM